jgi:hypothetical protein
VGRLRQPADLRTENRGVLTGAAARSERPLRALLVVLIGSLAVSCSGSNEHETARAELLLDSDDVREVRGLESAVAEDLDRETMSSYLAEGVEGPCGGSISDIASDRSIGRSFSDESGGAVVVELVVEAPNAEASDVAELEELLGDGCEVSERFPGDDTIELKAEVSPIDPGEASCDAVGWISAVSGLGDRQFAAASLCVTDGLVLLVEGSGGDESVDNLTRGVFVAAADKLASAD